MWILKENVEVDFKNYESSNKAQCRIADYIGIDKSTLNRILKRKQPCSKPIARLITMLNSKNPDIEQFFDKYESEI